MAVKMKRIKLFLMVIVMSVAILPPPQTAKAIACDELFYRQNNINYYDPCSSTCSGAAGGGSLTSPAPSSLKGATNQEKSWNYFIARGLTPVATAGAMGNIEHESGFSAAVEERSGGGGLGIIQWTGDRRTKLEAAASAANVNLSDNDSALLFELNYLWDGEYNSLTWQEQVNKEQKVEGNTAIASYNQNFSSQRAESQEGNGSTMVFHALVERSGDVPTEADRLPGYGVLQGRIDKANQFLTQFGDGASAGNCVVSAGGLNWDQAVAAAKKLVDNWDTIYCGSNAITGGNPGGYCNWTEGYCTAGAAWLATVTAPDPSAVPGIPDGVNVASRLISSNPDVYTNVNPDGSNIQPFSIWSLGEGSSTGSPGHVGTIVGVGTDGSIITLETNWRNETPGATKSFLYDPGHRVAVFQYPSFEAFKTSHTGYTFKDMATPKNSSLAAQMATKMAPFVGIGN